MSWAVRAWRDANGDAGITIGTVYPLGYDNHVAEFDVDALELTDFIAQCLHAMERANAASNAMREPLPGPYENWSG